SPQNGFLMLLTTNDNAAEPQPKREAVMERSRRGPHFCADFAHNGVEVPSAATEESRQADKISNDNNAKSRITPMLKHIHWNDVEQEKLNPLLDRQMITGENL